MISSAEGSQATSAPLLTIIIPTYQRPDLLPRAIQSALDQRIPATSEAAIEVVVVDDCSPEPAVVPTHPRLRLVRLSTNRGGAAARNEGARVAKGRYISYLDDDDVLLPEMAETTLLALQTTALPEPVLALGGIEVVNASGHVKETRLPPTLPKGAHFALEAAQPGKSFLCKQTMVVERDILLDIGGFDESFQSRVHTELFLRLNQVCSILGLSVPTYQLTAHEGPRVSKDPALRQVSFERLVAKHRSLFEAHPKEFSKFVYKHAQMSLRMGQRKSALKALAWAFKVHPQRSIVLILYGLRRSIRDYFMTFTDSIQNR